MRLRVRGAPGPILLGTLLSVLAVPAVGAQRAITRAEAVEAALSRGATLAIARADTTAASARVTEARAFPDPSLITSYSKDAPQYHVLTEWPLDLGRVRSSRISAAQSRRDAALLRFQYDRASVAYDADTAYTQALAATARARLSQRNATDADSLRRIAEVRRDVGDASDLDVQLAIVFAGQQANMAISDSLALLAALLDLQAVTGVPTDAVSIALADSLVPPERVSYATQGTPLRIAAASAGLTAADYEARLQRRLVWSLPLLEAGIEARDPSGDTRGVLPTVGLSIPLPLWNRNRGAIMAADAERERARAELTLARLVTASLVTRATREYDAAFDRLQRDQRLMESANRVVSMSLRAYQEGASSLASVLEAQRTTREVFRQFIDDLAAAWNAAAALRLLTLTPGTTP